MSRTTLRASIASPVIAGGTFTVPYREQAQADFVSGQTVTVYTYLRAFACAVTFGVSEATVTWPAGAPYSLPAGEYNIDFDLVGGNRLSADAAEATNLAALTDSTGGTADETLAAVGDTTSATNQAPVINNNFADINAKLSAVIANLKAAGLMEAD